MNSPSEVELSELLGVLSFGADLGMGQPMEHVLRQCLIALGLAERIGLGDDQHEAVYFGSLVAWVGCHVDAYEQAKWFGDETALKSDFRQVDFATATAGPLFMLRHLGGGQPLHQRVGMVPAFLGDGRRAAESMLENHWRASDELMERLGLDQLVRDTVEQSFERWDGRGVPSGARGERDPAHLAAGQPGRRRRGLPPRRRRRRRRSRSRASGRARSSIPELVETFAGAAELRCSPSSTRSSRGQAVLSAEPASRYRLAGRASSTRRSRPSPTSSTSSRRTRSATRAGVAALAEQRQLHYGLGADDTALLRRAALVHDLGRLGVPNTIWDKPGPLSPAELERARMHVYLTERMLASSPALAPLAAVAVQHHERLDGSGYPRGLTGGDITPAGRLLAAADSYHARLEPRPHRPAQSRRAGGRGAARGRRARAGSTATRAEAVLAAAGHRCRKRREWPAGLTAREVEILRLLARGHVQQADRRPRS